MRKTTTDLEVLPPAGGGNGTDGTNGTNGVSWERARELWGEAQERARRSGDALVELGRVLARLRTEYYNQGRGGDYKSDAYKNHSNRGVGMIEKGLQMPLPVSKKGWEAEVFAETGIPAWTARRIIDDAKYTLMSRGLADGEPVTYPDSKGNNVTLEPTEKLQAQAKKALADINLGLVKPSRAWAGICGEGQREGKERAEVDHAAVMMKALRSLRSSAKEWNHIDPEDRADIEGLWNEVRETLPATWHAAKRAGK